jgi:hypothetical protein
MLIAAAADIWGVIHRVLVLLAFGCCTLVLLSFGLFALDQASGASKRQQSEIAAGVAPDTSGINGTSPEHKQPRRFIDGAAKSLTTPFRSVVHSSSTWVLEIAPLIMALAVYGFGIGYIARYFRLLG